jgi:peptide/nickel transport system permease protein
VTASPLVGSLLRRPVACIASAVVLAFVVIALGASQLAPFDPVATNFLAVRKPPSDVYRLGTDEVGRDVLSRLIWGARASLLAGLVPVTIAVTISVPLGLLSGYVGGWIDGLIMRVTDAMLAIPFLIVAIALAAFLGPSPTNAMIAIGIATLPTFVRLSRGTALAIKTEDYVEAARAPVARGCGSPWVTCCRTWCRRC